MRYLRISEPNMALTNLTSTLTLILTRILTQPQSYPSQIAQRIFQTAQTYKISRNIIFVLPYTSYLFILELFVQNNVS